MSNARSVATRRHSNKSLICQILCELTAGILSYGKNRHEDVYVENLNFKKGGQIPSVRWSFCGNFCVVSLTMIILLRSVRFMYSLARSLARSLLISRGEKGKKKIVVARIEKCVIGRYAEPLIGLDRIGLDLIVSVLIGLVLIGLVLIG